MIVSFRKFALEPRYDGVQWAELRIYESDAEIGPWNLIDTQPLEPTADPADPQPISFTTEEATLDPGVGWYKVEIIDNDATPDVRAYEPVFNPATTEILATLDDINANLDGEVIEATADNSNLVQISVARVVRGFLASMVDTATLMSWSNPDATPDIVREIAAKFIAAQVYFNEAARQSFIIEDNNYAQRLYNQAMALLEGIIEGTIIIGDIPGIVSSMEMTVDDYFPVDDTDRAFTMGQIL